jgi:hypothetical protein
MHDLRLCDDVTKTAPDMRYDTFHDAMGNIIIPTYRRAPLTLARNLI